MAVANEVVLKPAVKAVPSVDAAAANDMVLAYRNGAPVRVRDIGVAGVPGSSFYHDPKMGSQLIRFCFCKKDETLEAAAERLAKLARG